MMVVISVRTPKHSLYLQSFTTFTTFQPYLIPLLLKSILVSIGSQPILVFKFSIFQSYRICSIAFITLNTSVTNSPIGMRIEINRFSAFFAKYYWHKEIFRLCYMKDVNTRDIHVTT